MCEATAYLLGDNEPTLVMEAVDTIEPEENGIASRNLFKTDRIHLFDVRCWTFDVGRSSVSFSI